jgi:hypothetical protein
MLAIIWIAIVNAVTNSVWLGLGLRALSLA